jgi:YidC/Oxa1 family membrane protein insertase
LFNLLVFFAWLVPGHSVGWSIILLTLLTRAILWAPSVKALKAPLQMKAHQDELKAVQEKHKDDRTAQAQATMAFYKERGINPLSGCLTLLIQLPVILILYQVFRTGLHTIRPDLIYSFTPHLDSVNPLFFGIDLSKPNKIVLPILAGLAQFLQARHYATISAQPSGKSNDPMAMMTKQMQYLFPFMTYFIALSLPAGLALYWITTTVVSLVQQVLVARNFKPNKSSVAVTVRQKR